MDDDQIEPRELFNLTRTKWGIDGNVDTIHFNTKSLSQPPGPDGEFRSIPKCLTVTLDVKTGEIVRCDPGDDGQILGLALDDYFAMAREFVGAPTP